MRHGNAHNLFGIVFVHLALAVMVQAGPAHATGQSTCNYTRQCVTGHGCSRIDLSVEISNAPYSTTLWLLRVEEQPVVLELLASTSAALILSGLTPVEPDQRQYAATFAIFDDGASQLVFVRPTSLGSLERLRLSGVCRGNFRWTF